MKRVIQILLVLVAIVLAYVLYRQFAIPMEFEKLRVQRNEDVANRLKDIRAAQRAYRQTHQQFTASMDSLILFVQRDSLTYERAIGSMDDSLALAQGRVSRESFNISVRDTVFSGRNLTDADIENFRYIPHSGNTPFLMDAGMLETGSGVVVPVFEVKAPFKTYLDVEGYHQQLVNLIDTRKTLEQYPGLKVGSMTAATNEAGNWE
jgi:hypothetical protein